MARAILVTGRYAPTVEQTRTADLDAANGFVVAHGALVDRARLASLRTGALPTRDVWELAESGQVPGAGWPASAENQIPSIDATCFRLAELADLGALGRPAAREALAWLASVQRPDGTWEEHPSLAEEAPPWAVPGDPEARLFLTANAAYWLSVATSPESDGQPRILGRLGGEYAAAVAAAAKVIAGSLRPDGTWPSFLVTGWLGAAVLYGQEMFYESALMQAVLTDRLPDLSAGDVAWLGATLRRVGVDPGHRLLVAAWQRLAETQRSDGGWSSDDGHAFDVHTTLTAIRALR